ncbi:hypothetical protein KFL_001770210 [Klebsormidium nitens]|uniref:EamA domain-containing protein n=1 Tax=Klebsormidium nitens TaxID=105231 RepID=A0A1Y1HZQ2_KLENI|nr:hypothetical protein KFL_001770210 [Klebsormidium nitens]|eukprot:GAQ84135.1 hypothetical protein KFL_001770210 [Klebsormidium nitens]
MIGSSLARVKVSSIAFATPQQQGAKRSQSAVRQAPYSAVQSGKSGAQQLTTVTLNSDPHLRSFRHQIIPAVQKVQFVVSVERRKPALVQSIQTASPSLAPPSPRGFRKRAVEYPVSTEESPVRRRAAERSRPVHTRGTAQVAFPPLSSEEDVWRQLEASSTSLGSSSTDLKSVEAVILSTFQESIAALRSPATTSTLLLHLLAALYGSNTVVAKLIDSSAADLPPSLTTLARYVITTLPFVPALWGALRSKEDGLFLGGCELGLQAFLGILCGSAAAKSATASNASMLFTFTIIVMPMMEIFAGRSVSKLTWGATLAAISAMGLLEWEGAHVHDALAPHAGDMWPLIGCALSAAQIFRSESLSAKFDPLHLTAVQLGVLTLLSAGWEAFTLISGGTHLDALQGQLEDLPWGLLLYSGLVCAGLCQWAELKGLRHVHASTATLIYTTIPVWGAFLSFLVRGEPPGNATTLGAALLVSLAVGGQAFRGAAAAFGAVRGLEGLEAAETGMAFLPKLELAAPKANSEALPAALLSTQLKLPFYAAEAQRVMAETKLRLAAAKSSLESWSGSLIGGLTGPNSEELNGSQNNPSTAVSTLNPVPDAAALAHRTAEASHAYPIHPGVEAPSSHLVGTADAAIHAGGTLAKSFVDKAEALGAVLTSGSVQITDFANEGLRTAASAEQNLAQSWITAVEPPLSWIGHVAALDVATWCHLLRH